MSVSLSAQEKETDCGSPHHCCLSTRIKKLRPNYSGRHLLLDTSGLYDRLCSQLGDCSYESSWMQGEHRPDAGYGLQCWDAMVFTLTEPRRMEMDLKYQAKKLLGKNRRAGVLTQQKNAGQVRRLCDVVQTKYGLQSIRNLKAKHIVGAFEDLKVQGLCSSTLASYATAARRIAEAIGKQNIVPRTNKEMEISRAGDRLKPVDADMDRIHNITELLYEKEEWLGLAAEMREQFGLRAKESLLSTEVSDGRLVVRGSKGGRPREIRIRSESQRELLGRIQDHIEREGKTSLIPSNMSLKQGLKCQSNAVHRLGGTKANNAHPHSARHAYAQDLQQQGSAPRDIAEELGHGRTEIVSHYVPK